MSDPRCWAIVASGDDLHVMPSARPGSGPTPDHRPDRDCVCRPTVIRENPLDDPIFSHNQPDWPGSAYHEPIQ